MEADLYREFLHTEPRHWWFQARREIVAAVVGRYLPAPATLLDIGAGTGYVLQRFQELGYDVSGVDPSPIAVEICSQRGISQVRLGSANDLGSVGEQRSDGALLLDVIEHVDDDVGALREARRVLKPGGRLFVTVPAFMFLWSDFDEINQHKRRYVRRQLDERLRAAGLEIELLSYYNCRLFPVAALSRIGARLRNRRNGYAEIAVPGGIVNRALRAVFEGERRRLTRIRRNTYPVGLSLMAVARRLPGACRDETPRAHAVPGSNP